MLFQWLRGGKRKASKQGDAAAPMRVLHIGKYYPPYRGGMESFLADLVEQQRASGIDACAVVHGDPLPDDPEWLIRVPVQVTLVFAPIALGVPFALWRAIKKFKPDVLHLHMPNNAAFWPLVIPAARRIPWVTHWHSDVLISEWDTILKACYQLYKPFETKLLQHSEAILATSPPYMAASQPLQPWLYKTVAIPLGLKPLNAETLELAQEEDVSEWGDAKLRILSVGRLTYYKGFDTLISAVAGHPDVQLLIAGEGEQRKELEALIAQERAQHGCANVRLLGAVSEAKKHALFNSCDIFALASRERTEAFGLVLIEAMQHGKPCIASDLDGSGMSWVVGQSGGGQCYAPDQVQAWKEAIRQALQAKAQLAQQGQLAQRVAGEQFTIAQCERRIHAVYQSFGQTDEAEHMVAAIERHLVVAALIDAKDLQAVLQWQSGAMGQDLLCVDATSCAEAATALEKASVTTVSLDDLDWSDVLEVVRRMVVEKPYSKLSILPASRLKVQPIHDIPGKGRDGLLQLLGLRSHRLGKDELRLDTQSTKDWMNVTHCVVGMQVFSQTGKSRY